MERVRICFKKDDVGMNDIRRLAEAIARENLITHLRGFISKQGDTVFQIVVPFNNIVHARDTLERVKGTWRRLET